MTPMGGYVGTLRRDRRASTRSLRLLHTTGVLTPVAAVCEALDWDLDRVNSGLDSLERRLIGVGMKLHRFSSGCR